MKKQKNIFITWHYTTHGIAYLKHILSSYYKYGIRNIYQNNDISQEAMNKIQIKEERGFVFDKVYYLTAPQKAFDKLSLRRFDYIDNIIEKDDFIKNDQNLLKIWKNIVENRKYSYDKTKQFEKIETEIKYVKENHSQFYRKWEKTLWRDIHHYSIDDQILWLGKYSNAKEIYKGGEKFIQKTFDINDFRNILEIAKKIMPFIQELKRQFPEANYVINASLGSNETQVVWQVLSELNILPKNTTLIHTYDNKEKRNKRFRPFTIKKLPNKIITEISSQISIYDDEVKSESRRLAELKMHHYINSGFTIFLLGERGIGKTRLAEKYSKKDKAFISVNCASFTNSNIAKSELFGHKKGSFTDAKEDKKGVFEEANEGILFLDEIHNLDVSVQAKLMKALQTDEENRYSIIPVGGEKKDEKQLKLTVILATNNSIQELQKKLLPDFYDRVTQLVIELPPLRMSREDIPIEFEKIWVQMKFQEIYPFHKYIKRDKKFLNWIKNLDLYGNYRDLQKIAIYYKTYLDFDNEIKNILEIMNPFEFAKQEFKKYIPINIDNIEDKFSTEKKAEKMIDEYKGRIANWAINKFHGAPNAAAHFKEKGGKTTVATLYKWQKFSN